MYKLTIHGYKLLRLSTNATDWAYLLNIKKEERSQKDGLDTSLIKSLPKCFKKDSNLK